MENVKPTNKKRTATADGEPRKSSRGPHPTLRFANEVEEHDEISTTLAPKKATSVTKAAAKKVTKAAAPKKATKASAPAETAAPVPAEISERKEVTAFLLRNHIDSENERHSQEISDEAIQHCCKRLSGGFSEKQIVKRTKQMAKGKGAASYEKLLVFMYALRVAGLDDLAEGCRTAVRNFGAP